MAKSKEEDIERDLIASLTDLKYRYRPDIRDRETLTRNFREKFEALNQVRLTDAEFSRLNDEMITPDVFVAAQRLRMRHDFIREDGTPLSCTLVNIKDWCKNDFEVINQLRINTDSSHHRYDVIILINGVPVVQIELKTLEINPRRAMEQIVCYKNDPGNGYTNTLLCFMQLFIVSNGSDTRYFTNNPDKHFSFNEKERFLPVYQHADQENRKITHLHDFARDFLSKCALGTTISRYMVLVVSEQRLMMMRPYQIYAVKAIVECIDQNRGNGYIWHTTGSGKTLTSFKAATLLKDNPDIDKCLFVVDRKDLDRQTRDEFNRFQEGCVEENTNTQTLIRRLLSDDYANKIIVTTIQKLGLALDGGSRRNRGRSKKGKPTWRKRLEPLRDKRMVFIFDECHRSQFGENHQAIKNFFPRARLFGFTGTPVFDENASMMKIEGKQASYQTTADIFQNQLHTYTISDAIDDGNVLGFHIDYYKDDGKGEKSPKDKTPPPDVVIGEILAKHDQATGGRRFNAILATASINDAIEYYRAFKKIQARKQAEDENFNPLNIACVFSPPPKALSGDPNQKNDKNIEDTKQLQEDLEQEKKDNRHEPEQKKAALEAIIADYNDRYKTRHNIYEFDLYYQDIQSRIKNQQYSNKDYPHIKKIDLTIVVDMLLTGFDSKYLNTLYIDKNLKYHHLIQAFSRTNRILNDTKPWGNIFDFRGQQGEVDEAVRLFSGKDLAAARKIWLVEPALEVAEKFTTAVDDLEAFMAGKGLECAPEQVANLKGDNARVEFINYFKEVQRYHTRLAQYTDLDQASREAMEQRLSEDSLRSFKAAYLDTVQHLKFRQKAGESQDDVMQQLDFELVLFASAVVDYDYIMALLARSMQPAIKEKMTRQQVIDLIRSEANMREEREDIIAYIESLEVGEVLTEDEIRAGFQTFKAEKARKALADMAGRYGLAFGALQAFVEDILSRMVFDGEQLTDLFAPQGLGWQMRAEKEQALMAELVPYLHKQAEGRDISGLSAYEE